MNHHRIAILGDSRVFDTYYATAVYGATAYGYHKTFPHLLQRMLARRDGADIDVIHIPDHFRGRTLQNNILRLALIDPSAVILCDGIWESLISKRHFIEYVEGAIDSLGADAGRTSFEYSEDAVVALFEANKLALSPSAYAERVATIASWFVRRRRKAVWMTTPIPPIDHLGGLHYAGNYRPFPGWHRCLAILNRETTKAAQAAGATLIDLHALMQQHGGAAACLIDQWHFSSGFHRTIADHLGDWARAALDALEPSHSSRVMVQGPVPGLSVHLIGTAEQVEQFRCAHPETRVTSVSTELTLAARPIDAEAVVLLAAPSLARIGAATALLHRLNPGTVLLFPEDLTSLDNPAAADRSAFGTFK